MRSDSPDSVIGDLARRLRNGFSESPIGPDPTVTVSPYGPSAGAGSGLPRLFFQGWQASLAGKSERAIALYEAAYIRSKAESNAEAAAAALFIAAREARRLGDPATSLRFVQLALELADDCSSQVKLSGYLALGHHLINAGKDSDVLAVLREAEASFTTSGISDLCEFLELYACANSMQGRTAQAMVHFDILLDISTRNDPIETQVVRLRTAAGNALTQGLLDRANSLHERSVHLANQYGLGYQIPLSNVAHAWTLLCAGDLAGAAQLLEKAERWPSNHFYVRYYRSAVGVLLGALTQDYDIVEKCLDLGALELAFKSEAPQRIGPIAAAVHQCHLSQGRYAKAAEVLSRSLRAIDNPDECWWLLLQVARSGGPEDVARGLFVLSRYADDFPLVRAHRLLLHARSAKLNGRAFPSISLASQAADILEKLGWRCHQAIALEVAQRFIEARNLSEEIGIFGATSHPKINLRREDSLLSAREWEIVHLVAGGLTNRQISTRLKMAERTVKYHLTSAFDKLGCHNRAALAEFARCGSFGHTLEAARGGHPSSVS
jgi:ATP/maltotriose-dependent transcriptional regulator MalT